jgi:hypothetical protein
MPFNSRCWDFFLSPRNSFIAAVIFRHPSCSTEGHSRRDLSQLVPIASGIMNEVKNIAVKCNDTARNKWVY